LNKDEINENGKQAKKISKLDISSGISTFRHLENRLASDGRIITIDHSTDRTFYTTMEANGMRITYDNVGKSVNLEEIYPAFVPTTAGAGSQ
jgi:hypothetical protein